MDVYVVIHTNNCALNDGKMHQTKEVYVRHSKEAAEAFAVALAFKYRYRLPSLMYSIIDALKETGREDLILKCFNDQSDDKIEVFQSKLEGHPLG